MDVVKDVDKNDKIILEMLAKKPEKGMIKKGDSTVDIVAKMFGITVPELKDAFNLWV